MKFKVIILSLLAVVLSSCAGYTLLRSSAPASAEELSKFKTYTIVAPDKDRLPAGMTMFDFRIIAEGIRNQMDIRGFKDAPNSAMQIHIGVVVKEQIETKSAVPATGRMYYGPRASYLRNYYSDTKIITDINQVGNLTVDIVDDQNQKYLYTATISNTVKNGNRLQDTKEVSAAMNTLFKDFPIKPIEMIK